MDPMDIEGDNSPPPGPSGREPPGDRSAADDQGVTPNLGGLNLEPRPQAEGQSRTPSVASSTPGSDPGPRFGPDGQDRTPSSGSDPLSFVGRFPRHVEGEERTPPLVSPIDPALEPSDEDTSPDLSPEEVDVSMSERTPSLAISPTDPALEPSDEETRPGLILEEVNVHSESARPGHDFVSPVIEMVDSPEQHLPPESSIIGLEGGGSGWEKALGPLEPVVRSWAWSSSNPPPPLSDPSSRSSASFGPIVLDEGDERVLSLPMPPHRSALPMVGGDEFLERYVLGTDLRGIARWSVNMSSVYREITIRSNKPPLIPHLREPPYELGPVLQALRNVTGYDKKLDKYCTFNDNRGAMHVSYHVVHFLKLHRYRVAAAILREAMDVFMAFGNKCLEIDDCVFAVTGKNTANMWVKDANLSFPRVFQSTRMRRYHSFKCLISDRSGARAVWVDSPENRPPEPEAPPPDSDDGEIEDTQVYIHRAYRMGRPWELIRGPIVHPIHRELPRI